MSRRGNSSNSTYTPDFLNSPGSYQLVIVESPSKCSKIEQYLGDGYKCLATCGHLRELPNLSHISAADGFAPSYANIAAKRPNIAMLKKAIAGATDVILACDNDREGESINAHICWMFNLDISTTKRIIFNEITEPSLRAAIQSPTVVNLAVVRAQQTRQIIDLIVGFKVSPELWKHISCDSKKRLSAGRCQSPALRIIYDNQRDIDGSVGDITREFSTVGYFTSLNIPFDLVLTKTKTKTQTKTTGGSGSGSGCIRDMDCDESDGDGSMECQTDAGIIQFLTNEKSHNHVFRADAPKRVVKNPPRPFTTSRIQQAASNGFNYSPKETMRICQTLYEAGLITYMRTDSQFYSNVFIADVKRHIRKSYPCDVSMAESNDLNKYISDKIDDLSSSTPTPTRRNKMSVAPQEAHEAIRPTNIDDTPTEVKTRHAKTLGGRDIKVYGMIWRNSLESCMSPGLYESIKSTITSSAPDREYRSTNDVPVFLGWKIVAATNKLCDGGDSGDSGDSSDTSDENIGGNSGITTHYEFLNHLSPGAKVAPNKILSKFAVKNHKLHYTESRLVQELESRGIGRPSTFSSLVDKIQEREYVKRQSVNGVETECVDYELVGQTITSSRTTRVFGAEKNKLVIQPIGIIVVEFLNRYFSNVFQYDYTKTLEDLLDDVSRGETTLEDVCGQCIARLDDELRKLNGDDASTSTVASSSGGGPIVVGNWNGDDVTLSRGKYGLFISWGRNKKTLKSLGNRPTDNIRFDEIIPFLETNPIVREVSCSMSVRHGKPGKPDYLFFKTATMRRPRFLSMSGFGGDSRSCDLNVLKDWIGTTYDIF